MRRTALLLALLAALIPAALHAQQPDSPDAVLLGIRPPARVRLTLKDSTTLLGRAPSARWVARFEGTLVGLDTANAVVRLNHGYTYTIPVSNVRLAEQSVGAGFCRRRTSARVLCTIAGLAIGGSVGFVAGRQIGATASGFDQRERLRDAGNRGATRGALLGAVIGVIALPALGRDRWQPVVLVPAPAGPTPR